MASVPSFRRWLQTHDHELDGCEERNKVIRVCGMHTCAKGKRGHGQDSGRFSEALAAETMPKCRRTFQGVFVRVLAKDAQDVCGVDEEHFAKAVVKSEAAIIGGNERGMSTRNKADANNPGPYQMAFLSARCDCSQRSRSDYASGNFGRAQVVELNMAGSMTNRHICVVE